MKLEDQLSNLELSKEIKKQLRLAAEENELATLKTITKEAMEQLDKIKSALEKANDELEKPIPDCD